MFEEKVDSWISKMTFLHRLFMASFSLRCICGLITSQYRVKNACNQYQQIQALMIIDTHEF